MNEKPVFNSADVFFGDLSLKITCEEDTIRIRSDENEESPPFTAEERVLLGQFIFDTFGKKGE